MNRIMRKGAVIGLLVALVLLVLPGMVLGADKSQAMARHMALEFAGNAGMEQMVALMNAGNPGINHSMADTWPFQMPGPNHP